MKPTDKTKQFWLMLYAIDAFQNVMWACDSLLKRKPDKSEPTYRSLIAFILSNYGRPFHGNHGVGRLDANIVPAEYRSLHDQLIRDRDKILAHTDTQGIPTYFGNANQVRLLRLPDSFKWVTSTYISLDDADNRRIHDLCQSLTAVLDKRTDEYERCCLPEIKKLSPGEYLLNTKADESELFTKVSSILPPNDALNPTPI